MSKENCMKVFNDALTDYAAANHIESIRMALGVACGARAVMLHAGVITIDEHAELCNRVSAAIDAKYPQAVQP